MGFGAILKEGVVPPGSRRLSWLALLGVFPGCVWAALTVNSATLNGSSSVSVLPGAAMSAATSVTTTLSTGWRGTAWRVSTTSGTMTCQNTPDHTANGTYSESFSITAPTTAGTYNAYFMASSANGCGNTTSPILSLTNSVVVLPPSVVSINRVNGNPTTAAMVSWTVTFNESVTGVDAADFALVTTGSVAGAGIASVTGSGTTYTVTAYTGTGAGTLGLNLADNDSIQDAYGNRLGGVGAGNGNFSGQSYDMNNSCVAPANIPSGVTVSCVCDRFARTTLNPSTIYSENWIVSTSDSTGILPTIVNPGYLRLTNNTGNNAKAATVPGIFPAAGNYISVEFQHYAYSGSGADGIAVTLSDYSVPAVPGAFGGSLGYAQRDGIVGFAGGWIGVALDEYGNYQNPTEGRLGGTGFISQSVGIRGSGSKMAGYRWLAGTTALSPQIDNAGSTTPARGYTYQVVVDARGEPTTTAVQVNRDTGSGYQPLISLPNVYTAAAAQGFTQSSVPANWQISFTGSTGGSTNIHEIGALRICAQSVSPPTGGVASGFNAIDEGYGTTPLSVQNYLTGHIYTKLLGVPFKLNVAALNNSNQIVTTYAATGSKSVTVKLVDNSDGVCVINSSQANYCSAACKAKAAVADGSQTLTFAAADSGQKQSANFTLNTAYQNLVAIISDSATTACSTDAFSVRPTAVTSVVSSNATNTGTGGTPIFKAVTDKFALTATVAGVAGQPNGYTGVLKINNSALNAKSPAVVAGAVTGTFQAAVSAVQNATATGSTFAFSEVGGFVLLGVDPTVSATATSPRGVYDDTWTALDSVNTSNDCIAGSYSNVKDSSGKYGCNFGLSVSTGTIGRFVPDHFAVTNISFTNRPVACASSFDATHVPPWPGYSYLDEAMNLSFTLEARAGDESVTRNYGDALAKLDLNTTNTALDFAAAQPAAGLQAFAALSGRLTATGYLGAWPTPNTTTGGVLGLSGTVTVSSLNTPASNRVTPDGPFVNANIGIFPLDSDGVRLTKVYRMVSGVPTAFSVSDLDRDNNGSLDSGMLATTALYFGMLRLNPAIGSERLPLTMSAQLLYWNGAGFVPYAADTCTSIPVANLTLGNWKAPLAAANTSITNNVGTVVGNKLTFVDGQGSLRFSAPGVVGSVDLTAGLSALGFEYLQGRWGSAATKYDKNPTATATFGIYKGAKQIIHMRENF